MSAVSPVVRSSSLPSSPSVAPTSSLRTSKFASSRRIKSHDEEEGEQHLEPQTPPNKSQSQSQLRSPSRRSRVKFQEEDEHYLEQPQDSAADPAADPAADSAAASKSETHNNETGDDEIPVGVSNKWHNAIQNGDWLKVERLLKKYDQTYYKRKREQHKHHLEKEEQRKEEQEREEEEREQQEREESAKPKSSRRLMLSRMSSSGKRSFKISSRSFKMSKYVEIISPLLERDEQGKTPLHLICSQKDAPDKLLLDIVLIGRHAVPLPDKEGLLPLHVAVNADRYTHILEKIIKAHPNALKTKDNAGRTPIAYALILARQRQQVAFPDEDPQDLFRWSEPISGNNKEKDWQFSQEKHWTKVDFLLTFLKEKNKSILPSEHGLILQALECGAPPKVIDRFIDTSSKYLRVDDLLAGPAILQCIQRRYPLKTLSSLLANSREKTTIISDSLDKSLIAHYHEGCCAHDPDAPSFGKELIHWSKENNASSDEKDEDETMTGLSKACQDWWEILKHLLLYCAYGKQHTEENKSIRGCNMLHAALAVTSSPPSLLQLLMALHPKSRTAICPVLNVLPIHLACSKWRYDMVQTDNDAVMQRTMKQLLKADATMVWVRYRKRLPIHLALAVEHSWSFIQQMALVDKRIVGMRDPQTKLFPFQMAAIQASPKIVAAIIRCQYTPIAWRELPKKVKEEEYKQVSRTQNLRQLNTIFELLKLHPDAVRGQVITIGVPTSSNLDGVGKVASHYLNWCYARGRLRWHIRPENIKILSDAAIEGSIPMALEPWWEDMKSLIRECYPGQKGSIPDSDDYLLHAALYNPDTPPLVIELILELYPDSAALPLPGTHHYPLHIVAGTNAYRPQAFEIATNMDVMELTLMACRAAVRAESHGRLPIHVAVARGKTWKELRSLVEARPSTLRIEDPQSKGLAPFQVMATFCRVTVHGRDQSIRFCANAERKTRDIEWHETSTQERGAILRTAIRDIQLDSLSTVFELLRREPSAIRLRSREYILELLMRDTSALRSRSPIKVTAPALKKSSIKKSKVLPDDYLRSGVVPITREDRVEPSLATFFEDEMGQSTLSLLSEGTEPTLYSYFKPSYDDDLESTMGASVTTSSSLVSPPTLKKKESVKIESLFTELQPSLSLMSTPTLKRDKSLKIESLFTELKQEHSLENSFSL